MHFFTRADRRYAQFERLGQVPGLAHAFTTRPLDVSPRPDGNWPERAARRRQMALDLELDPERICYCRQVHQDRVAIVDDANRAGELAETDAVVTGLAGVPLMTFSADCPLILLYEPRRRVLGLAHASWRCTAARLAERVVRVMESSLGCRPADLLAGIGPGAGPCCYEVRADVLAATANLPGRTEIIHERAGRHYLDLWTANACQLDSAGVPRDNMEFAGICTMCRTDLFYSFRREGEGCGHFGLLAALRAG